MDSPAITTKLSRALKAAGLQKDWLDVIFDDELERRGLDFVDVVAVRRYRMERWQIKPSEMITSVPSSTPPSAGHKVFEIPATLPVYSVGQDPRSYLLSLRTALRAKNLEQGRWVLALQVALVQTDSLRTWAHTRLNDEMTWDEAERTFIEQFSSEGQRDEDEQALQYLRQDEQSVVDYGTEFLRLARLTGRDETENRLLQQFRRGLKATVRQIYAFASKSDPPQTISAAIQLAREVEASQTDDGNSLPPGAPAASPTPATTTTKRLRDWVPCRTHPNSRHQQFECQNPAQRTRSQEGRQASGSRTRSVLSPSPAMSSPLSATATPRRGVVPATPISPFTIPSTPVTPRTGSNDALCFRCNQPGHLARSCPQRTISAVETSTAKKSWKKTQE